MADYVDTTEDNGGVHLNSGIPNRAFALAATSIGGHSWEQAGRTWYDALSSTEVTASTDFTGFAEATVAAATRLFADTDVPAKVRAAWVEVGVLQGSVPADATETVPSGGAGRDAGTGGTGGAGSGGDPAPGSGQPADPTKVAVRRSGGFTGQVRSAEIELGDDERAQEVRQLLRRVDLQQITTSGPAPDRFVYTVEVDHQSVTLGERDLSPDLQRVVQIVLGGAGGGLPGGSRDLD
jgi:hypothetical protein